MITTIIALLNFAFKCRLVNETRTIALVQAGTQANQLAGTIDHAGNIPKILPKIVQAKVSFFLKTQKRRVL